MWRFSFDGLSTFISGESLYTLERVELEDEEFELPLVEQEAVMADAARLALAISNHGAGDREGLLRMRLLHSLVGQEIQFLAVSGEAVPEWLLMAMDDTEWAVEQTQTAAHAA